MVTYILSFKINHFMKQLAFSLIAFLIFAFSGCSSSDDSSPNPAPVRTFVDLQQEFSEINFATGNNDVSIRSLHNTTYNFRVILPDIDMTNNKRPLIITLHGASGDNPDAHKSTACFAEPGFEALNAIIISPNGGTLLWHELYNQQMVLSLVDLASRYLPVDTSKIVVNGYSNGGNGAWFFAETKPEFFSAGIPMASSYNTYSTSGAPRKIDVPLYVIHGENDELFPLEQTQEWVTATRDAGTDVTLEVAPGLSHNFPCEYVQQLKNAAAWLENDIW